MSHHLNHESKVLTLAMKLKHTDLTPEEIQKAMDIAKKFDSITDAIKYHLAGYRDGRYKSVMHDPEFGESLVRHLHKNGWINWDAVPKYDPEHRMAEKEQEKKEDVTLLRAIILVSSRIGFKLDDPEDFPEGGFSLHARDGMHFVEVKPYEVGNYTVTYTRTSDGGMLKTDFLRTADDVVIFCHRAGLRVPTIFRDMYTTAGVQA